MILKWAQPYPNSMWFNFYDYSKLGSVHGKIAIKRVKVENGNLSVTDANDSAIPSDLAL